ncbi:MAG: UDP-N-acetylglucosamine 1-carboxyvinyltransferase [Desulfovibrio sp.]|jgi:UDP-N-acetylglucosamine 1-carboxyvinyltransferase|nr:UDP-N-acetylglucosamine 1-carboxyvinyltransferase [Desulfovibrio sp.]
MEKLVIEGGVPLRGTICVSGSKNAALPILFAALLLDGPVTFHNVPRLRDISTAVAMLGVLGCPAGFTDDKGHTIRAEAGRLLPEAPYELVKTMRASVLVLGPLLARLGRARVALPGGCAIGARPVEQHTRALEKMGAVLELDSGYIVGRCDRLRGADITFDFPTVGGTEHLIMAASLAEGDTFLRNAAREPEVVDLADFLNACGARISGQGTDTVHIRGVSGLRGETYSIMPDRIEAGTFLAAAAVTGGDCDIAGCPVEELTAVMAKMGEMGISLEPHENGVAVHRTGPLRGVDMTTRPYPGFPTDMQAQLMVLMALAEGSSTVEEKIFENRFMHVPELSRMGADIKLSGSRAVIRGVRQLTGAPVMASDLRASASLVIAGLAARGKTQVQRIYHLDRGYEGIERKLEQVGARIRRERDEG